jgi:DNA-binding NarL/FixJ family response regulator
MALIKTVIFEDSEIDVRGIRELIKGVPEIMIVGVFDTLQEALYQCKRLEPRLILSDADIRGDKSIGPQFVRGVRKLLPEVKILGLTRYPECIKPLKLAGCNEVVLKQFFENEEAARKYIGETLLEIPRFSMDMVPPALSDDEDAVLRMIAEGHTENEIGAKLKKTRKQIRLIKESLKNKFGANRDPQLVSHAYKYGYLKPDEE